MPVQIAALFPAYNPENETALEELAHSRGVPVSEWTKRFEGIVPTKGVAESDSAWWVHFAQGLRKPALIMSRFTALKRVLSEVDVSRQLAMPCEMMGRNFIVPGGVEVIVGLHLATTTEILQFGASDEQMENLHFQQDDENGELEVQYRPSL